MLAYLNAKHRSDGREKISSVFGKVAAKNILYYNRQDCMIVFSVFTFIPQFKYKLITHSHGCLGPTCLSFRLQLAYSIRV